MMEKYGADPASIPYTDEQHKEIKKIASELGVDLPEFKTQEEAQNLIDNMSERVGRG